MSGELNTPKGSVPTKEKCPQSSRELLRLENSEVSHDKHLSRLFSGRPSLNDIPRSTRRVVNSAALTRVLHFLPKMKAANDALRIAVENGTSVDIEDIDETAEFIEMNLEILDGTSDFIKSGQLFKDAEAGDDSSSDFIKSGQLFKDAEADDDSSSSSETDDSANEIGESCENSIFDLVGGRTATNKNKNGILVSEIDEKDT